MGKLLIAGIDPGTMNAYALLDVDGVLIALGSARHLAEEQVIKTLRQYGKIFIIGTGMMK